MAVDATDELGVARAALRARQGLGARYDSANAPALELGWARRGTAYFARKLNELSDADLWAASLVPGWSRREVIAAVGYHARALTRVTERARTGADLNMFATPDQRADEIADGATLPAGALRHLVRHAGVHLNVEWRDLSEADWDRSLAGLRDEPATARETPWTRAAEVWIRAIDLGNGGSFRDCPEDFLRRLIARRLGAIGGTFAEGGFGPDRLSAAFAGFRLSGHARHVARFLFGYGGGQNLFVEGDLRLLPGCDRRRPISEIIQ